MNERSQFASAPAVDTRFRLPLPEGCHPLRLLATTDLHGHLTDHDYITDRPVPGRGLVSLGALIARFRAEPVPTLLLDNGDLLQGTALSEEALAEGGLTAQDHPMFAAQALLGYDAATLGNHEFNLPLERLAGLLAGLKLPLVLSNVTGPLPVARELVLRAGPLRVGVIGLVPPEILRWDHVLLAGRVQVEPMLQAAQAALARLRGRCDLVVALAHSGLAEGQACGGEAMGEALADLPGLDALVLGHGHKLFPAREEPLAGKPAVMPGHGGSHLGVIDLVVGPRGVVASQARLVRAEETGRHEALARLAAPWHARTRARMAEPVGVTGQRLTSWFDRFSPGPALALMAEAGRRAVAEGVAALTEARLPLLAQAAPFLTGGRGGPGAFLDIPAGPLLRRHLYALAPFSNPVCAIVVTGAALRHWIETSAEQFTQLSDMPQPLVRASVPGYLADTLYGVSYRLDLTAPPGQRLRELRHEDTPVADARRFLVATNTYRAGALADCSELVWLGPQDARQSLAQHLPQPADCPRADWGFLRSGAQAWVETAPGAELDQIAPLSPEPIGLTPEGFLRVMLTL